MRWRRDYHTQCVLERGYTTRCCIDEVVANGRTLLFFLLRQRAGRPGTGVASPPRVLACVSTGIASITRLDKDHKGRFLISMERWVADSKQLVFSSSNSYVC